MKNFFVLMLLLATKCINVMTCPEKCSCSLSSSGYSVDCYNRGLGFIPADIPNNTYSLDLRYNNLIAFDVRFCQSFLRYLYVTSNGISEIPNGFFTECSNLETLDLNSNKLFRINPDAFTNQSSLRTLNLGYNNIMELDLEVCRLFPALQTLDLEYNKILAFGNNSFVGCESLKILDLSGNKVSGIGNYSLSECKNLRNLQLNDIGRIKLDAQIFQLFPNLETLSLKQNQISEIGNDVFMGCRTLTRLDLSNNRITEIKTEVLQECNNLKILSLSSNQLTMIEENMFSNLSRLESLDLNRNSLTTMHLAAFRNLTSLHTLNIAYNKLLDFKQGFPAASYVRFLYLQGNLIRSLDFELCSQFPKLNLLYLSGNQISNISEDFFTECYSLGTLYLANNKLADLPDNFFRTKYNLGQIYLGGNQLTTLDDFTFANISKLQRLEIENNFISTIHKDAFQTLSLKYLRLSGSPVSYGGYDFLNHCGQLQELQLDNTRQNESHVFIYEKNMPMMLDLQIFYISNNMITDVEPALLSKMPNLVYLQLQNNRIQVIKASTFLKMDSLYELHLYSNNISHFEKNALGNLPRLRYLYLSSNPFMCDCRIVPLWSFLNERKSLSTSARCSNGTYVNNILELNLEQCNPSVPHVVAELMDGEIYPIPGFSPTPSLIPVFRCISGDMSYNSSYIFDINWYINGNLVSNKTNVTFEDLDAAVLRENEWIDTHKLNMQVKCSVRRWDDLTFTNPNPYLESKTFFAGFQPEHYEYTVLEGEATNITFRSTVPVGCISSHSDIMPHCDQNFYISQPKFGENTATCFNKVSNRDVVFETQFCGLRLTTANWNEKKELTVYGFNDGLYNYKGRTTYIKLSTASVSELNDIWKNVHIPEIKITVLDKDSLVVNRLCQIHNDPHVRSFDGRIYDYMEVGEFVMYRNDKGPYVVHVLFSSCGAGITGPSCSCGVAIRSRNSLFVFRLCKTISKSKIHSLQQPVIRHYSCDENDMFIEQSKNTYTITLPHGTEIKFTTFRGSRFVSGISIKPSVYDLDAAKGLCGIPNTVKDLADDFTDRNGMVVNDPKHFGDSWRIKTDMTSEQLFVEMPEFLNSSTTDDGLINEGNLTVRHYCACEKQAGSTDSVDDFYTVNCNLTETTEFCPGNSDSTEKPSKPSNPLQSSCSNVERRKRSIYLPFQQFRRSIPDSDEGDDVTDFDSLTYDDDAFTETVRNLTFRDGWTYERAFNFCTEKVKEKIPEQLYDNIVDLPFDYYRNSCIEDIKLVADDSFLSDTVGAMATFILTEVSRNESLYYENTTDGTQSVIDYITSQLCPNNCSDNGTCISGDCSCFDGYVGDDCSQETTKPPSNISLPSSGLCIIGLRPCRKTNVGGYFPSTTVWYSLTHFQIHKTEIRNISTNITGEAEYKDPYTVSVTLPESRRRRSTSETFHPEGFYIRLSNDGKHYGDTVTLVIFDDNCYSCNATEISCIDRGVCKLASDISVSSEDKNVSLITIGVVTVMAVAFVILVIGIVVKNKVIYNKRKHDKSYEYDEHGTITKSSK